MPQDHDLGHVWILRYRYSNNPQADKNFIFNGSLPEAVVFAKQYCEKMGYRYIQVRPFLSDIGDIPNENPPKSQLKDLIVDKTGIGYEKG